MFLRPGIDVFASWCRRRRFRPNVWWCVHNGIAVQWRDSAKETAIWAIAYKMKSAVPSSPDNLSCHIKSSHFCNCSMLWWLRVYNVYIYIISEKKDNRSNQEQKRRYARQQRKKERNTEWMNGKCGEGGIQNLHIGVMILISVALERSENGTRLYGLFCLRRTCVDIEKPANTVGSHLW